MFTENRIGVRELVEFFMRSGDLDNRTGAGTDDMLEGARLHRKIQQEAGEGYLAEVSLSTIYTFEGKGRKKKEASFMDGTSIEIEGRADGIFLQPSLEEGEDPVWTIDEIKTTARRLESIREPVSVHLAQAKCYAFMYAKQEELERIDVRMTYCSRITEKIRYFYREYTFKELSLWFDDLMAEYRRFSSYARMFAGVRTASLKALAFPFPYREGQKDLAAAVYRTIARKKKLFMEAPTGTGKTVSTLFPAMKAMGEGVIDKVFYLIARTTTAETARETIELLREHGMRTKSIVLTAKERMCILEKPACNPEECPRAQGHFDRVNEAIYDLITHEDSFTREVIDEYAARYAVCPFELGLDMAMFSDVVIGDYNYLFDPHAGLKRFFGDDAKSRPYVFLIDEAHNLVERGRAMYSAELSGEEIGRFKKKVKAVYPELEEPLAFCESALSTAAREIPREGADVLGHADVEAVAKAAEKIQDSMEEILARQREEDENRGRKSDPLRKKKRALRDDFLSFYFILTHFALIYAKLDSHYICYAEKIHSDVQVKLCCADPAEKLKACMDRGRAAVLFSATFLPVQYYKKILGGEEEDYEIYARSVFDKKKRGLFIVRDVTSRYTRRGEKEYERIADTIHSICEKRYGNYMVFFPSYSFLAGVSDIYERKYCKGSVLPVTEEGAAQAGEAEILRQKPGMTPKERESFLSRFDEVFDNHSLIGMCILGGIFSEGIDLKNDRLIGAVIVGTGIPMVNTERKILKSYFDASGMNGYDYAYRFPGMNKVLQAAGRVIRTKEDTGIVALLDDRFARPEYQRLFPREWDNKKETTSKEVGGLVEKFWRDVQGESPREKNEISVQEP